MHRTVPLFLDDETVAHIDWLARQIAKKKQRPTISQSAAVTWLVKQHRKKFQKKTVAKSQPLVLP